MNYEVNGVIFTNRHDNCVDDGMFPLGTRVILKEGYEDAYIGITGTVACVNGRNVLIVLDEQFTSRIGHNADCRLSMPRGYWVNRNCLEVIDTSPAQYRKVTCACCGNKVSKPHSVKTTNNKYVCSSCMAIKGYSTESVEFSHKDKKHGKTYGFEFECVPKSRKSMATVLSMGYGFIPTSDCSLPSGGVEFKTPIFNSLNGMKSMFKTLEKYLSFSSEKCGHHINIGDKQYINSKNMERIRNYKNYLFDELQEYMYGHKNDTVAVCGRFFKNYCDYKGTLTDHYSFINLYDNKRIEFRISKYKNAKQYFALICMWTEMVDCIINNFLKKYDSASDKKALAKKTGHKLVSIFVKYAEKKASCQSEKRNKVAA